MKTTIYRFVYRSSFCAATLLAAFSVAAADEPYRLLKEIPVRDSGAWTAMVVDEAGQRLYAAHGSRVEVINLKTETPAGAITDTPDVRGFAIAPAFHLGFASSGKAQTVNLVDLNTLRTNAKMKTGANPTAVVIEPSKLQLYAFNQGDHSVTAGEADDGDFLATIDVGGKPVSAVADAVTFETKNSRVLASIEDKNEVVAIDVATHKVLSHWPVSPGQSPRGLAYDALNHRLFAACGNRLLIVMDSTDGKVVTTIPIGEGAGEVAYDSATQNIFTSSSDGTVTIAHEDAPDKISVVQTLKTKGGATVLGMDGKSRKIYVGSADFGTSSGEAAPFSNPIAGTLKILVYGK